jgi:hypothetical protein
MENHEIASPNSKYGYFIVLVSALIMVIAWGANYSFGVFFKPLISEFGWSRAITSSSYAFNIIIWGGIGPIIAGRIYDIYGSYYWALVINTIFAVCGLILSILLHRLGKIKPSG